MVVGGEGLLKGLECIRGGGSALSANLSFHYKNIRVKSSTSAETPWLKSEQASKNGHFSNRTERQRRSETTETFQDLAPGFGRVMGVRTHETRACI